MHVMNINQFQRILIATHGHGLLGAAVDRERHQSDTDEHMRHLIAIRSENEVCGCIQEDVIFDRLRDVSRSHELQLDHVIV